MNADARLQIRQAVAAALLAGHAMAAGAGRPNVLFIITDQQQAGMLSCAGNRWLKTPAMGSLLRRAGYETAYAGKVHVVGGVGKCGFDELKAGSDDEGTAAACVGFLEQQRDKPFLLVASFVNPHDICYLEFGDARRDKAADDGEGDGGQEEKANVASALKRPDGVSKEEFFAKHGPPVLANFEPQENAPDALGQPSGRWSVEQWRQHRWTYCRLTEQVDREIGRVLQALRDAGLEEKTVIVFTSDHGEMKNLAADPAYADVLARHRQYLREWLETNQDKLAGGYLVK